MTTFELEPTDFTIRFAYYIKNADGDYDFGPEQTITITDCFFDYQAEQKFWELTGNDYANICLFDTEEADWTTEREVLKMEKDAIVEHLFGTTQFGQTDAAIALKYYDHE